MLSWFENEKKFYNLEAWFFLITWFTNPPTVIFRKVEKNLDYFIYFILRP